MPTASLIVSAPISAAAPARSATEDHERLALAQPRHQPLRQIGVAQEAFDRHGGQLRVGREPPERLGGRGSPEHPAERADDDERGREGHRRRAGLLTRAECRPSDRPARSRVFVVPFVTATTRGPSACPARPAATRTTSALSPDWLTATSIVDGAEHPRPEVQELRGVEHDRRDAGAG